MWYVYPVHEPYYVITSTYTSPENQSPRSPGQIRSQRCQLQLLSYHSCNAFSLFLYLQRYSSPPKSEQDAPVGQEH